MVTEERISKSIRAPGCLHLLKKILATSELFVRTGRPPNYQAEAIALGRLSKALADSPETILQRLAEEALRCTTSHSAGVSIIEPDNGTEVFRWRGVAGQLGPFIMETLPRDYSPCGFVVDTGLPQLMRNMVRYYHYVEKLRLSLCEVLLVPFSVGGRVVGTIWAVYHSDDETFDTEDLRILSSLSQFAASAFLGRQMAEKQKTVMEEIKESESRLASAMIQAARAQEEAERANNLKSAFLANMSHEIRTPLGAMLGFADLLRDPGLSSTERANFLETLTRNGESLAVIINDILDVSKAEVGHLEIQLTNAFPDQICADVISLLGVKAKIKGLSLDFVLHESTPKQIVSDPIRIRQILINLVGNAIKFTQFGSVQLMCYGCPGDDGATALCFEISDTGLGIPDVHKAQIFELFVQGDGTSTRKFGGTGLGLSLSKRLARILGGDVSLISTEEGHGSRFLVKVADKADIQATDCSLKNSDRIKLSDLEVDCLFGKKVLVVDDASDNRHLIWRYLTKYGAVVETADNGMLGYRAAMAGNFDIILMDIQMPVMDGYTATQKLRQAGYEKPIIALTAHAMSEIRVKALSAGYTDHLPKPIDGKNLVHTIQKLIH